jgi:hypothetical protein
VYDVDKNKLSDEGKYVLSTEEGFGRRKFGRA